MATMVPLATIITLILMLQALAMQLARLRIWMLTTVPLMDRRLLPMLI